MSEPTPPASAPQPAPVKSGNRVLIIIVCVVLGFVLLVGGCVSACVYFGAKKAREFSRSAQKNPVYASLSLAASLLPDIEVVSKDEASGKITVRNKRTGEVTTINSNDYTKDNVDQAIEKMTLGAKAAVATAQARPGAGAAAGESKATPADGPAISAGKAAAMADILKKFPDYAPAYPGGTTLEVSQNAVGDARNANYVFNTSDKLDAVVGFYEKKGVGAGFTVAARTGDSNDFGPTAMLNLVRASPQAVVTLSAESKAGGRVEVTIALTELQK
jgi:hypothetical protein